jgi:CubicO group peptidase (beta-lactamase class C family)
VWLSWSESSPESIGDTIMARALDIVGRFPVPIAAAAVIAQGRLVDTEGPTGHRFRLASIGKPIVAWACLVGCEEGTVSLDDPVGPDDGHHRTLRHLLSHASGYGFDEGDAIVAPERRRMYGNHGIEVAAEHLAVAAGMPFADYLRLGVFEPLGMDATELRGSPAYDIWSTVDDLVRFLGEARQPRLVSGDTAANAVRPHFPTLGGIVPGVGRFDPCPWGLGFEVRGEKSPHWTGTATSRGAYGHFGGAGTMMWFDPVADVGVVALTDRPFDEWAADALELWPAVSDAALTEFASSHP